MVEREKNGLHRGVRYVTNIDTKESAELARLMLNVGIKIRHASNLPPMSFGVSDKAIAAIFESMERGNKAQKLIISTEPAYLKHFAAIFEEIWRNGIDADQRINEIREGVIVAPDIEIIRNPSEAVDRLLNLLTNAEFEVMGIFPTINAFRRQLRMGIADRINHLVMDRGVHIRVLIPGNAEKFSEILRSDPEANKLLTTMEIGNNLEGSSHSYNHSNDDKTTPKRLEVKCIDLGSETTLGIVVVDRMRSFIIETKDDTKSNSYEAAGLGAYSNSKHVASSYASIFEFLWKQIELSDQLKLQERMQNEFINTAAHELRTPIQPILSVSHVLYNKHGALEEHLDLLEIITRNAYRLKQLTEDILDVSRIEGKSLNLTLETFDLVFLTQYVVNDFSKGYEQHGNYTSKISFLCRYHSAIVYGDKMRLEQIIRNLLTNALNFAPHGSIIISLFRNSSSNEWIVSVKDTGEGINPDIFPRLFNKFVTKSLHGIGLGLYISKNIIEAQGGRIWAKNNKEGNGATFSFALPMARDQAPPHSK